MKILTNIIEFFIPEKKVRHVWKETGRETLGRFTHYGNSIEEMCEMYKIAIHEKCLLTGETRMRETSDFFPAK